MLPPQYLHRRGNRALGAPFRAGAPIIDQRAVILGLATWYQATGDERIKGYADRHVAALKRIARKERESWYYPASEYLESGGRLWTRSTPAWPTTPAPCGAAK